MRVPFAKEIDPLDKRLAKVSKITLGFIKVVKNCDTYFILPKKREQGKYGNHLNE